MAITRLTDIIEVFDSKWTYGDVKFGYEGEVNQDHDIKYPLMLVEPPESTIPSVYDGREEYTFEINFYNLYSQDAQSVVELQKRWDNLQDMANEWLDFVLKNYQDASVEAYLEDENIEIERVKEVANDRLVQIKLTFTMSAFTKCFRPVSNYPSDYSDLVVWLKADSGATFDIASKRVSAWADQSGNSNDVAQSTTANQPLRHGYDGANDKAYFSFDGTNDTITSDNNCPLNDGSFTIFTVAKQNTVDADAFSVFSYKRSSVEINIGFKDNKHYTYLTDGTSLAYFNGSDSSEYAIVRARFNKNSGRLTSEINNSGESSSEALGWDENTTFSGEVFNIGSDGSRYIGNNIEEVIVFNRVLTDNEIKDIKGYLNTKYKIY